jgi:hypothetical protein
MRQQLHAETLVGTLLDHYHIKAELVPFYFFRVRAAGVLEPRDFKPRWKSHAIPACDRAMFAPFVQRAAELRATGETGDEEDVDGGLDEEEVEEGGELGGEVGEGGEFGGEVEEGGELEEATDGEEEDSDDDVNGRRLLNEGKEGLR